MYRIRITAGHVSAEAGLNDSKTAKAVWDALPITGRANLWGDEIYFAIPVDIGPENARAVVEAGDLAYWPVGKALCIFWGPTPASTGSEIRPASPVNVFGRLDTDPKVFDQVPAGSKVLIEKVDARGG